MSDTSAADQEPENDAEHDFADEASIPVSGALRMLSHLDLQRFQPRVSDLSWIVQLPVANSVAAIVPRLYPDVRPQFYGVNLSEQLARSFSTIATSSYAQTLRFPVDGLLAFHDVYRQWASSAIQSNVELITRLWKSHRPENWTSLDFDRHTDAEIIMSSEGIPLVWVPRAEIVKELCDASSFEDRCRILRDHSEEIMEDCRKVLAEVPDDSACPHSLHRSASRSTRSAPASPNRPSPTQPTPSIRPSAT